MSEMLNPEFVLALLTSVVKAIVVLTLGWMASKWAQRGVLRALQAREMDPSLGRFVASIVRYGVLIFTAMAALDMLSVETTSFVAVLASAGFAVGLALQGSLSNFAAGVLLLFFRPFDLGQRVKVAGHDGRIEDIGLFATTLRTSDNRKVIIPNSNITGDSIVNEDAYGTRRGQIDVGVAYGADVNRVAEVLRAAAASVPQVLEDPAPEVAFTGMGASALDFALRPWCREEDYLVVLHGVRTAAYDALNAEGIDIPFDQIVVHGLGGESA